MFEFNTDDLIVIDDGDNIIFNGTREDFRNQHFDGNDDEIIDWCFDQGYRLTIDGKKIFD
jgi:hypothetical protein